MFKKAVKQQKKLRMAITGPAGSGKTYTALAVAQGLGGPIALIDTEHGSASLYSDQFGFDTEELTNFNPKFYISAIKAAEEAGYKVLIIDSISHAWRGVGGVLEIKDNSPDKNKLFAWKEPDRIQNQFIEAILSADLHIIVTMRSKMAYAEETENGRKVVKKIGMAPIQRDGVEYEFDVVMDMDKATGSISKTRCAELQDEVIAHPDQKFGERLLSWLSSGVKPMSLEEAKAEMDAAATEDELHAVAARIKAQLGAQHRDAARVHFTSRLSALRAAAKKAQDDEAAEKKRVEDEASAAL